jgi:SAM-dependent methyltransferase
MQPDVVSRSEELPFADGSFDLVVSRLAAHHFANVRAGFGEMARIAARMVIVVDNSFGGDALEEAEKVRDPSHVRCYMVEEWRGLFADAGLTLVEERPLPQRVGGLARSRGMPARRRPCSRARRRPDVDGWVTLERIALKGVGSGDRRRPKTKLVVRA